MQKAVLIGRGYWGKILAPYIQKHYELCGIFGRDNTKEDLKTILENIDSVFIATPLATHYPLTYLSLECKCNVFLEKPSSETQDEFLALQTLAQRHDRILFTDYIYTFSQSIRFGIAFLKNDTSPIKSIHACIKQYGNFYPNENVLEVIGVHYLSVFAFMQETGLINRLCVESCKFLDTKKQSALLKFYAMHRGKPIDISLECSLLSQNKKRTLHIQTTHYNLCIDMLSQTPLQINNATYTKQMPCFDEGNNLDLALTYFKQMHKDLNVYKSHLNLCQTILGLLTQAHQKAT